MMKNKTNKKTRLIDMPDLEKGTTFMRMKAKTFKPKKGKGSYSRKGKNKNTTY